MTEAQNGLAAQLSRARNGLATAPDAHRKVYTERLAETEQEIVAAGLDPESLVRYDEKYGHWVSGTKTKTKGK